MTQSFEPFNLGDLVDRTRDPHQIAYIDLHDPSLPREFTHGEIDRLAKAVARRLSRFPVGTRIGILSDNRAEYAATYFGITRAGLIAVPINSKAPAEIVNFVIDDAAIPLLFVDHAHLPLVKSGIAVIDFDQDGPGGFAAELDPGDFETHHPGPDDIAEILYTSGSTGRPRALPSAMPDNSG